MQTLGGVTLGVEIVGAEVGVKSAFAESIAAADEWAKGTQAAGIEASRGINLVGLSAAKAELAYGKFGETILATNAKIDKSLVTEGEGMRLNQEAAVRYMSTTEGLASKQAAASTAAAAAAERGAFKYQAALLGAGRTMTTYLTLPLAIAGYASIKLATDFQASMMRIRTYAGATQQEVNRMSDMILRHAGELPQGPIVSSEAVYHLESIGIRGKQAFDALRAASIATGAGMADPTDATTALGGALVSTIKGAHDAKTAMAGLVAIAGMGNMTMQDLSNALGTGLLAKAANVGVPLRDIGSALAVLVDRGIPARRSATYLGTTLALMSAPSKEASNSLHDMGINANNMATMLRQPNGLLKVLDMLHAGMERVGQAQGARDLMSAFGRSRQSTGIITLVESMNAPISSYSQKLAQYDKGVADAAERMAAYQQTAQYKIHTALSQLEADFIKLGQGAAPGVAVAIKGIAGSVNNIVNEIEKLPGPIKDGLGVLAGILAVGGPLVLGAGLVLKLFTQMGQILAKLGGSAIAGAGQTDAALESIGTTARTSASQADTALTSIGTAADEAAVQVTALNDALERVKLTAVEGSTPFGGGYFLKREGQGIVGSTGGMAMLGAPLQEGGPQSVRVGGRIIGTTESLTPEALSALGLSEATTAENAFGASLVTGLKGVGSDLAGVAGRAMQGGMFAMGGMMAGSLVESMVPGRTGQEIGRPLQMAGLGAGIGTMIEPGIGTAIGAGVGVLAGGVMDLIHSGPSFVQQMGTMAMAVRGFGTAAQQAGRNVTMIRANIANLQVSKDQAQVGLREARSQEVATRGTSAHKMAVDQLRAAQMQLLGIEAQMQTQQSQLAQQDKARAQDLQKQKENLAGIVTKTYELGQAFDPAVLAIQRSSTTLDQSAIKAKEAAQRLEDYKHHMLDLANSAQSSDPKLAQVYYKLHDIAVAAGKIPTHKQVQIAVHTSFDKNTKALFFGLGDLGKNLNNDLKDLFKGVRATVDKQKPTHATHLSADQSVQVALAKNPNDKAAIEAQIKYDRANIARLNREKAAGKITADQYVTQVSAFYGDLRSMEQSLKSMRTKASSTAGKATSAFDKKVHDDTLLSKARLDLENGQYAAAQKLLAEDKQRLEMMLHEAKNSEERNAVMRQLLEVEKLQKSKIAGFALSKKLQEEMARADALAALDPNQQGPTALQIRLAKEAKAAAMKVIHSHNATLQALIDAWNIVGQANATIAQGQSGVKANLYHVVSTDTAADAVKGLTHAQEMQLREALAQRDAHRGNAPNGPVADGYGAGTAAGPGPRGTMITFHGTKFEVNGVQDVRKLMAELERLVRQKYGRSGHRR